MDLRKEIRKRKRYDVIFTVVGVVALMIGVLTFAALFTEMARNGIGRLDWDFFTSFPSRRASQAGNLSAWGGSPPGMAVNALLAGPPRVSAGGYSHEYPPKNRLTDPLYINIPNPAAR